MIYILRILRCQEGDPGVGLGMRGFLAVDYIESLGELEGFSMFVK